MSKSRQLAYTLQNGIGEPTVQTALTRAWPKATRLFLPLGVGHRQRQRQFFQRALLGRDTKPQFDQA